MFRSNWKETKTTQSDRNLLFFQADSVVQANLLKPPQISPIPNHPEVKKIIFHHQRPFFGLAKYY